ncbi:Sensor histidine kinase YycG [uncultured Clostridium sp.]|uniref:histidine kinase n=1 Tax=Muricoprocola aceti TaxID=2981772 RepID=A0ABT2SL82_9FIRM|nr:HAMP domain-containing sensor histidine kinase [Muricoprocola aceti]MCI7227030.1 HAMP domain-containing histidine kinase [Lachnospiraceae bacterium]SCH44532.1 Sensor histidine kinase YycG [uncultured Clostridium sp.]MCU6725247.1 HAMP domain-containing histidine kinase [Muricoprocola aceti]MDD7435592.1 HAMP domain-containing sensor histidine kinase [Lachnospiraceae bacterium]MDY3342654.1 HAMP domain-containing sensor histidine kinase [Lachnospiraceae bacterium]
MKLKTRLFIAFAAILIIPIMLMSMVMLTVGNRQFKALEKYAQKYQIYQGQYEVEQKNSMDADEQEQVQDNEDTDGGSLSEDVTDYASGIVPEFRSFLYDMATIIIVILVVTAAILMLWIYAGISVPLNKLRNATHKIAEGNLNFTMEVTGEDEISDLCRDFEEMRKRLLESTEQKLEYDQESKELISNISHDLKTPLTAIKGYVEGIMDGVADTPEKMDRYIRTIYNKTNDMDRLINELTFYSKIDANRIPYTFNKINVKNYFEDCVEEMGIELESKGFAFSYKNEVDDSVEVIADAEQIKRVINNIVSNSVKYMDKSDPRIDIRVKDVGDFVQIEIEDNGRGIGTKELPNIFERFYRADASRHSAGGSGIGLSIVKKIIEDHGGKIWASSTLGKGTVMYFVLRKYQEVLL